MVFWGEKQYKGTEKSLIMATLINSFVNRKLVNYSVPRHVSPATALLIVVF